MGGSEGVTATVLERASAGDEFAFRELTEPFRRELEFHCYRMLGSVQDAEDVMQETMLAAWRALANFERRSSLRTWLYRIATNRCLNVLRDGGRRPHSIPPLTFEIPAPTRMSDSRWLEPYPNDRLGWLADSQPGPAARYESREAVELAFISALQRLPGRQRAVLVLRDVLGFHAAETAAMLETSVEGVKSALKRARVTIERELGDQTQRIAPPPPPPWRSRSWWRSSPGRSSLTTSMGWSRSSLRMRGSGCRRPSTSTTARS